MALEYFCFQKRFSAFNNRRLKCFNVVRISTLKIGSFKFIENICHTDTREIHNFFVVHDQWVAKHAKLIV